MANSVKERIKVELEQAQAEGKVRANRISDILKAAASMTFEEIKEGSSELNTATRKSVAEILEELKEAPESTSYDIDANVTETALSTNNSAAEDESFKADNVAPTWRSIIRNAIAVVRDRKGDWFQAFKKSLNNNANKFDQEMSDEYGDRYLKVRSFFQRIVEQIKAQQATAQTASATDGQPVSIEVVDGDEAIVEVTPKVQVPESEEER